MPRILAIAPLLALPSLALAETPAIGPAPAPTPAPAVVAAPTPAPAELSRRWGVGARAVSMSLSPDQGETSTDYAGGGFTASYRINPRWEVALAFDALDTEQGPDLHSTLISARFHLWPLRRWDAYLLAGIGALHQHPLEGDEGEGVSRGQFHAGVGVGHRWRYIGVAAELHLVGVGTADEPDPMTTARSTTQPMATTQELSGGEFTIATSFFF